jgi:hypothetical protein
VKYSNQDWPPPAQVEAIAESLRTNRSSSNVRALSQQFDVEEQFVVDIASHVANDTFTFNESLIFESAPQPKGTNAMPKSVRDLTSNEIREMSQAIQRVGTGPAQIAGMAQRFNISESDMSIMAKAITNVESKSRTTVTESGVTEATPPPGVSRRDYEHAAYITESANRAEADLQNASIGDLYALAEMNLGERMFPTR